MMGDVGVLQHRPTSATSASSRKRSRPSSVDASEMPPVRDGACGRGGALAALSSSALATCKCVQRSVQVNSNMPSIHAEHTPPCGTICARHMRAWRYL